MTGQSGQTNWQHVNVDDNWLQLFLIPRERDNITCINNTGIY